MFGSYYMSFNVNVNTFNEYGIFHENNLRNALTPLYIYVYEVIDRYKLDSEDLRCKSLQKPLMLKMR